MYYRHVWIHILTMYFVIALFITTEIVFTGPEKNMIITLGSSFLIIWAISLLNLMRLMFGAYFPVKKPEDIVYERVEIPLADGIMGIGQILKKSNHSIGNRSPALIFHHGVSSRKESLYRLAYPFVRHGYIVLGLDARGHGETKRKHRKSRRDDWYLSKTTGIFPDFSKWIQYLSNRNDIDSNRMAVLGHSMGGSVVISQGLMDPRIKLCVALNPLYSFEDLLHAKRGKKFLGESWFQKMFLHFAVNFRRIRQMEKNILPKYTIPNMIQNQDFEKVRLIHCKDDELLLFETHALPIQKALHIPENHCFFPLEGGHPLRGQEIGVFERILVWLEEVFPKNLNQN